MARPTVFVVGGDSAVRDSVRTLAESAGLRVEIVASLQAFVDAIEPGRRGCLVFESGIGEVSDQAGQARLAAACARVPALLITDRGDVRTAVLAMNAGAFDVVQKPYKNQNLLDTIKKALEASDRLPTT